MSLSKLVKEMSKISFLVTILTAVIFIQVKTTMADTSSKPVKWDKLNTTFGYPGQTNALNPVPRTKDEAIKEGYVLYNKKKSCEKGSYLGFRYIKKGKTTVMPLYDANGIIAGIQTTWLASAAEQYENLYPFTNKPLLQTEVINNVKYYVETAYFIPPANICGKDVRTLGETGTDLYYQNGSSPLSDSMQIQRSQVEMDKTKWTKGGCFPKMGVHYFYEITADKDCKTFVPFFIMYNKGYLTGFGFVVVGNFTQSDENEHPPRNLIREFFDVIPDCLLPLFDKTDGFTTLHVFFNTDDAYDC